LFLKDPVWHSRKRLLTADSCHLLLPNFLSKVFAIGSAFYVQTRCIKSIKYSFNYLHRLRLQLTLWHVFQSKDQGLLQPPQRYFCGGSVPTVEAFVAFFLQFRQQGVAEVMALFDLVGNQTVAWRRKSATMGLWMVAKGGTRLALGPAPWTAPP